MMYENRLADSEANSKVQLTFSDAAGTQVGSTQTVNLKTDSTITLVDHVSDISKVRITVTRAGSGNVGAARIVFYDWRTTLIQCASEGGNCHCIGRVKYGAGNDWTSWMTVDNGVVECNVAAFG